MIELELLSATPTSKSTFASSSGSQMPKTQPSNVLADLEICTKVLSALAPYIETPAEDIPTTSPDPDAAIKASGLVVARDNVDLDTQRSLSCATTTGASIFTCPETYEDDDVSSAGFMTLVDGNDPESDCSYDVEANNFLRECHELFS